LRRKRFLTGETVSTCSPRAEDTSVCAMGRLCRFHGVGATWHTPRLCSPTTGGAAELELQEGQRASVSGTSKNERIEIEK